VSQAISHAGAAVGILSQREGVVLAAEKKLVAKLLDPGLTSDKMYVLDTHVAVAVAGITSDANILIGYLRESAQRFLRSYGEPIPVEQLVQQVCDLKQSYTQFGGLRPYGVSFLYAGWDSRLGFQLCGHFFNKRAAVFFFFWKSLLHQQTRQNPTLTRNTPLPQIKRYQSDPSGNYGGWRATAIGANNQAATSILKTEYKEDMPLHDALLLALKILSKTMDTTQLTPQKVELGHLTLDPTTGLPRWTLLSPADLTKLIAELPLPSFIALFLALSFNLLISHFLEETPAFFLLSLSLFGSN